MFTEKLAVNMSFLPIYSHFKHCWMINTHKIDNMTFKLQPLAAAGMAMQVTTVSAPKTKGVLFKKDYRYDECAEKKQHSRYRK